MDTTSVKMQKMRHIRHPSSPYFQRKCLNNYKLVKILPSPSAAYNYFLYLSKFRESGDFQPPSLVVRQVEVESVHLVHRHGIQKKVNLIFSVEVPGHIEMHSTPGIPGC